MNLRRVARGILPQCLASVTLLGGCGGTRAVVQPGFATANQGKIVEAIVLTDGRSIVFDTGNTAGPGPDPRARIQGESVRGTVDGIPMTVVLDDIEEVVFGMGPVETEYILLGIAFAAVTALVLGLLFLRLDLE